METYLCPWKEAYVEEKMKGVLLEPNTYAKCAECEGTDTSCGNYFGGI